MKQFLYLIVSLLMLASCNKEESKKWIVADIHVVDSVTGEPVQTEVTLAFIKNAGAINESGGHESIGVTNDQGFIHIQRRVNRKESGFWAEVTVDSQSGFVFTIGHSLDLQGSNDIIILY